MLNKQKHEQVLKNILRDVYTTTGLEGNLAFKGGTYLYLFYQLDRFSVDLDFNLLTESFDDELVTDIISRYLSIDDQFNKHFTWFWLGSYEKDSPKIKVEINKREYPDKYVNKDFYGLTISTLAPASMFAHKLCAITDRKRVQNRDLFDAHFMFTRQFDIDEEIIRIRTGRKLKEYLLYLIDFIEKNVNPSTILDGLGELISDQQKLIVKDTLVRDLLFDLKSRV